MEKGSWDSLTDICIVKKQLTINIKHQHIHPLKEKQLIYMYFLEKVIDWIYYPMNFMVIQDIGG